jgi:hypothetical protein
MKRVLFTLAAVAALGGALAACETATPYQPLAIGAATSGGYGEQKINDDVWRVTFAGNSLTSRETVERYLLYRAADLTVNQGFDWFVTTDRKTDKKTTLLGDPFYRAGFGLDYGWGWRPSWRYRGAFGWRTYDPWLGGPFWADNYRIEEINRYQASAEIRMGRGPKPDGALDARQVQTNLGPSIIRPEPGK